ncbi:MAG: hypothetical protein AAF490_14395 [Chloroflexota bacterium]
MNTTNVLFLCPHAAAKSVIAMTYFQDLANKADLNVTASNAGTEPDPAINPKVDQLLRSEGFNLSDFKPKHLEEGQLAAADIVVSIGCIEKEAVPTGTQFLDWSDVPMLSDDFQGSRNKILAHAKDLVTRLKEAAG